MSFYQKCLFYRQLTLHSYKHMFSYNPLASTLPDLTTRSRC